MRNLQEEGRRPGNDTGTKVQQIWVSIPAPPLPSWMVLSLSLPVCEVGTSFTNPDISNREGGSPLVVGGQVAIIHVRVIGAPDIAGVVKAEP